LRISGERFEHEVLAPKGDTDEPMTWEDVEQKWKRAIRQSGESGQIERLKEVVKGLNGTKRADELCRVLSPLKE
jgi:2-methylcitrate dehydratase PrpD